jgi:hypothetical protein
VRARAEPADARARLAHAEARRELGAGRGLQCGERARGAARLVDGLSPVGLLARELVGELLLEPPEEGVAGGRCEERLGAGGAVVLREVQVAQDEPTREAERVVCR